MSLHYSIEFHEH